MDTVHVLMCFVVVRYETDFTHTLEDWFRDAGPRASKTNMGGGGGGSLYLPKGL